MRIYNDIVNAIDEGGKQLAILIDPDKFLDGEDDDATSTALRTSFAKAYLKKIPTTTTHILVGGSTDGANKTEKVVLAIKANTNLPVLLFPGNYAQITKEADAILYLSLLSGRNPEYLIGQQVKGAIPAKESGLEVIPTGYLLIDGGSETAVQRVSETAPLSQKDMDTIVATALAGQFTGKKCIYLEAGSGAQFPVKPAVIRAVKNAVDIPLIVGGGIRSSAQLELAYNAGADIVVIGTAFETDSWNETSV
ncbi:geranylgeranylglyceryl/heptaprenylglyceryl phosphate synthase [Dokdonia sinensis]|uniref:Geranylgeranylglyceryl phosphate synthase n=1 Tax=Dokdonia sinensis TaxID=2479847 RepID=A0A3M0G9K1_9FLAO|nr:geranylgeranylglyceryl/heptaprenylglyceryl phosphate synthase [Dokdonia sinensis]RMB59162.1 geranylgeranylglyceryl/heptaprenylglyceryl phosphate synthase [Dokdonia sinensis]